jgi:hypothetical protein
VYVCLSGRLWVSLTEAQKDGKPDTNILYGSKWTSAKEIVSAVRLSAYIPGVSSPSATLKLDQFPNLGSAYDGGFTQNLPCPPGACTSQTRTPVVWLVLVGVAATYV